MCLFSDVNTNIDTVREVASRLFNGRWSRTKPPLWHRSLSEQEPLVTNTRTMSTTTAAAASSTGRSRPCHAAWKAHGPSPFGLTLPVATHLCTGTLRTTIRPASTSTTYRRRRPTRARCAAGVWRPDLATTARRDGVAVAELLSQSTTCTDIGLCRVLASSTVFWWVMRWIRGGWSPHSSSSSSGATRDLLTVQTLDNTSTSLNILSTSDTSILASSSVDIGITSCVCVVERRHRIVIVDMLCTFSPSSLLIPFFSPKFVLASHSCIGDKGRLPWNF